MKQIVTCKIPGCGKPVKNKGACNKHYTRFLRYGSYDLPVKKKKAREVEKKCSVEGCNKLRKANTFCTTHYQRMQRHGTTELTIIKTQKQLLIEEGKSYCPSCDTIKPLDCFCKDSYATLRIAVYCKECTSEKGHLSYCQSKNKRRNYEYQRLYKISLEEYNNMLAKQEKKCLICGKKEEDKKHLAVDHNHKTGEVRGLLCSACNIALGGFNDSIDLLNKACDYLKKYLSPDTV